MLELDCRHRMYWEECGNASGVPVVFLTSRTDVDEAAQKCGALACLRKPLFAPDLLAVVSAAVPVERVSRG